MTAICDQIRTGRRDSFGYGRQRAHARSAFCKGIYRMRALMEEEWFSGGGTEARMRKKEKAPRR